MRLLGPPLITTPRAIKRLTNSYGLLAAIQRQTTAPGNPNRDPDSPDGGDAKVDRPAMVLLAALIGFAALGPALFVYLHQSAAQDPQESWTAFLLRLNPVRGENGHWANPAAPVMTPVEAQSWRTLLQALREITHNAAALGLPLPQPVEAWSRWIVPVGRLSFPTGRIVSSLTPRHLD